MAFRLIEHGKLERNVALLGLFALVTVAIGGLVQITPLFWIDSTIEKVEGMRPYTPLEQAGRNIYVREGCYVCHSQMIRSATKSNAMANTVWRQKASMTIHSNGGRSGLGPIWRALVGVIRMNGTVRI